MTRMPILYPIGLEHLCEVEAYLAAPIPIGQSSWGIRLIFPLVKGAFQGPRIVGRLVPISGDWALIRADNCLEIDVRAVIETRDGALIYCHYRGISDMTGEQVQQFLGGKIPRGLSLYVTPRFETSHKEYQCLTRIQAVGRGGVRQEGDRIKVSYSWYVLTELRD